MQIEPDGTYGVCCEHQPPPNQRLNIQQHTVHQWLRSDYLRTVRDSFDQGLRHPGCAPCWRVEDQGHQSLRLRTRAEQHQWQQVQGTGTDPVSMEVSFTNLCNLRCFMCNETDSSAIRAENHRLGIPVRNSRELDWHQHSDRLTAVINTGRVRWLNIVGGEPFMDARLQAWLGSIDARRARNLHLHIPTNCTHWSPDWTAVLERFASVRLMFSLDAVGDHAHYVRYPSDWLRVQDNIQAMRTLPNAECMVSAVVQNLNIGRLDDLMTWCRDRELWLTPVLLTDPDCLHITNLPYPALGWAANNVLGWTSTTPEPHLLEFLGQCFNLLIRAKFDPDRWQRFLAHVEPRDRVRDTDWRQWIPAG